MSRVLAAHPRAKDMHTYISDRDGPFKLPFVQAYNCKCAYCGVSMQIIQLSDFHVDHFVYEKSKRFNGKKASAGFIDNLIASCSTCNVNKGSLEFPDSKHRYLNPDLDSYVGTFYRNDMYYICVSEKFIDDADVQAFYSKLKLNSEVHRLDYLLMSMQGLSDKMDKDSPAYGTMMKSIELLHAKRNSIA